MASAGNFNFGMDNILSSQSSSIDEDEMQQMESAAVPETTSHATKSGIKKLTNWLKKRNISINFHTITEQELSSILRRFYAELKRDNGKALTPSSLVGIRAAISRYVIAAPFYRNINIVSGPNFTVANRMFDTKCKLYYKCNNPKPKHKAVIEEGDMKKLGLYFKNYHQNPILLTETIWFLLCFHFPFFHFVPRYNENNKESIDRPQILPPPNYILLTVLNVEC